MALELSDLNPIDALVKLANAASSNLVEATKNLSGIMSVGGANLVIAVATYILIFLFYFLILVAVFYLSKGAIGAVIEGMQKRGWIRAPLNTFDPFEKIYFPKTKRGNFIDRWASGFSGYMYEAFISSGDTKGCDAIRAIFLSAWLSFSYLFASFYFFIDSSMGEKQDFSLKSAFVSVVFAIGILMIDRTIISSRVRKISVVNGIFIFVRILFAVIVSSLSSSMFIDKIFAETITSQIIQDNASLSNSSSIYELESYNKYKNYVIASCEWSQQNYPVLDNSPPLKCNDSNDWKGVEASPMKGIEVLILCLEGLISLERHGGEPASCPPNDPHAKWKTTNINGSVNANIGSHQIPGSNASLLKDSLDSKQKEMNYRNQKINKYLEAFNDEKDKIVDARNSRKSDLSHRSKILLRLAFSDVNSFLAIGWKIVILAAIFLSIELLPIIMKFFGDMAGVERAQESIDEEIRDYFSGEFKVWKSSRMFSPKEIILNKEEEKKNSPGLRESLLKVLNRFNLKNRTREKNEDSSPPPNL